MNLNNFMNELTTKNLKLNMRKVTSFWLLLLFMASTTLFAQSTNMGISSKRDAAANLVSNDAPDPASAVQAITKGNEPVIAIDPMELTEEHLTPQITSQTLTITNNGTTPLEWEIEANSGDEKVTGDSSRDTSLCVDNLYTEGCAAYNDGIVSWKLANVDVPNIPCAGQPSWYHDYRDMVHELTPGQTYILTVTPGYNHTRIRVWIDFNDDFILTPDEIIISDGYLLTHLVPHEVWFEVPANAPGGTHVMRVRTNYDWAVPGPCETLDYGNCCDFSVNTGRGWLLVNESTGVLGAGESTEIEVTFNSTELPDGTHGGSLNISSNDPGNALVVVPATLIVGDGGTAPSINVSPTAIGEYHYNAPQISIKQLTIKNEGTKVLNWDIDLDLGGNKQTKSVYSTISVDEPLLMEAGTASEEYQSAEGYAISPAYIESGTKSVPTDGIECPPNSLFSQPATNHTQAHNLDEGNGFKLFQSFSNGGQVSGVRFWCVTALLGGSSWEPCDGIDPRPFDVAFYEDNGGLPGDKILGVNDLELSRVNTGVVFGPSGNFPVYEYTVELPGTAYIESGWFSLQSKVGGGDPLCWNMAMNQPGGMGTLLQYNSTLGYNPMDHPMGFCLLGGPETTTDVGVQRIISPVSGVVLTSSETMVFKIRNFGSAAQSNIPYSVIWDGPTGSHTVNATYEGSIAPGQAVEVTLDVTANLATWGDYVFTACTELPGDQGAAYDCATKIVTNSPQTYCSAGVYYQSGEYISRVEFGSIDNPSGRQFDVADYTHLYTDIPLGGSEIITVTNGWPHPEPHPTWWNTTTYCWVDWNKNYLYEGDAEWFVLTLMDSARYFTGPIIVPEGTPPGDYRMRVRLNQPFENVPCGKTGFGEVEEYTVRVGGGTPDQWMSVSPENGSLNPGQQRIVTVSFNSNNLDMGLYAGAININSNDPDIPLVEVPATLNVGVGDALVISPTSFTETHIVPPAAVTTKVLNLSNSTGASVDWSLDINAGSEVLSPGTTGREGWLTASPDGGTLAAGETIPITISFDSEGLGLGIYNGSITIISTPPYIYVPLTLNVIAEGIGAAPINLDASIVNFNNADLTWNKPLAAFDSEWFTYSAENINNAIGRGDALNFDAAARWTPDMLANYNGGILTTIDFVPYEPTSVCTYTVKVWQGGNNNPVLVYSQLVPEIELQDWTRVTLDQPVVIDVTKELWIGFNINTTGGFPAGCDDGPQVEGFGNMMTWNGGWSTLTNIGGPNLTYNWAVKGYIEGSGLLVESYNIFRKDDLAGNFNLIGSTGVNNRRYLDVGLDNGNYYYHVKALYAGGESAPSNEAVVQITSVSELSGSAGTLQIYPNPTKDQFTIKSETELQSVTMVNYSGQVVYSRKVAGQELLINAREFAKGVYTLQVETSDGRSIHKMIIQ